MKHRVVKVKAFGGYLSWKKQAIPQRRAALQVESGWEWEWGGLQPSQTELVKNAAGGEKHKTAGVTPVLVWGKLRVLRQVCL